MNRFRPSRRIFQWIGAVTSFVFLTAWAASLKWDLMLASSGSPSVYISGGVIEITWGLKYYIMPNQNWLKSRIQDSTSNCRGFVLPSIRSMQQAVGHLREGAATEKGIQWVLPAVRRVTKVQIPLWLPLLCVAAPTSLVFYRHHRPVPREQCGQCDYNLSGNISGICPECGKSCDHL